MPQRHSKNNNDLAFFTYDERKKLGYGTQRERLGKDSLKPFDSCCICLQPVIDPLSCNKGHLFCKECIFECLLAQKKNIKRKLASFTNQEKNDKEEELEKLAVEKQRELDEFERQNNAAEPQQQAAGHPDDRHVFQGANSVRVTSYEEEALRTMKAFWLPSATPEAVERVQAPSFETCCPEGNEKLKLKDLFPVVFTDLPHSGEKQEVDVVDGSRFMCPSCSVTLTNTLTLVAVSACGHVFCKKCADQFIAPGKECLACNKPCKAKNLVTLEKGGTGFSGHDDTLEATSFKHVGGGTGMGLARPTTKL